MNENNYDDDDDVTDDDVVQDDNIEDEEDENEASYLETITGEVLEENAQALNRFVSNPTSPEEVAKNESVKKFIALKVRERIMKSFGCRQQWEDDEQLKKLYNDSKRAMKKDENLEAEEAMKQVIRKSNIIDDVIERILEDQGVDEDNDDDEE